MNKDGRTKNVGRNVVFNLTCQMINVLLSFISRTVFIKILGADYLGINGLFTNILTILSFAELGVGGAIIYNMYKPLAENDIEKLKSLMALYKKAYTLIGTFILILGLCIVPFLDLLIADKPDIDENLSIIYVLFLMNTSFSYFFLYKRSMIIADQRAYVVVVIEQIITFIKTVIQIILLLLSHAYLVFLVTQVVCTLLTNSVVAYKADKLYPFLKEKAAPLEKKEQKQIFTNIKAIVFYRLGSSILNGTDNLIISAMLGVTPVGLVSNYTLIITTFNTLLTKVKDAFVASIGNLNATEGTEKQYNIFLKLQLICFWMYGFCTIGLFTLGNDFIRLWIGEDYLLSQIVLLSLCLAFFENGVHFAIYTYRTTLGYFVQGRLTPLFAAILNIILSIVMCKVMGLSGIFFATVISRLLTYGIIDPYLVYKNAFKKPFYMYYIRYAGYVLFYFIILVISELIIGEIAIAGLLGFIIKMGVVTLLFNGISFAFFYRTKMFKEILVSLRSIIR